MFESAISIQYSPVNIVFNIILAVVLGFFIAWGHRKTYSGLSFSESFGSSLLFLTIIAAIAIMVIGNNIARAFGLVGAFSIIRFRTVVKDTKNTAYVFLAIVVGMAVGSNNYFLAFVGCIAVLVTAFILTKKQLSETQKQYLFSLTIPIKNQANTNSILKNLLKSYTLTNIETREKTADITYVIELYSVSDIEVLFVQLEKRLKAKNIRLNPVTVDIPY